MERERNLGLDFLRMLSMLMVVVLHLLGRGGVLADAVPFTANYWIAWALESAAYCAVNCYALLSGYLLVKSRCPLGGLIGLWLQVFCYSAGITALFAIFYEPVSLTRFLQACLPVTFTQYWYFTAYFAVYLLAPFFNRLIANLSREAFRRLLWTVFLLFSVLTTVFHQDPFITGNAANGPGYSFLWLAALYFGGAYLRLYPPRQEKSRVWLLGYLGCLGALLLFRLGAESVTYACTGTASYGGWLLTYPSPLVVGEAVCLFHACRCARWNGRAARRIIGFFAPVSFGVYLIHAQPFVFHRILNGAAVSLLSLPGWQFALALPAAALGIFLAGSLVDWTRLGLFRLLGIRRLAEFLGEKLQRCLPPI